jgi:hypothetical protein
MTITSTNRKGKNARETNILLTSWCNEMIFTEKIEKELI